jgi:ABC-2 type transport system permease protein
LRRLSWLIHKDVLESLRSHTALIVLLSPLLLAMLLRTLGSDADVKPIPVATVSGPDSGIVRVLQQHEGLAVTQAPDVAGAQRLLRERTVVLVIQVDADFDEQIVQGLRPTVRLWSDRGRPTQVLIARGYLRDVLRKQADQVDPARVELQAASPANRNFWLGSAALLACMSSMVLAASNLVEEKEAGTLQQMLMSPASPTELWVGKLAVSAALGSLAAMLVVALHGLTLATLPGALGLTVAASFVFAAIGGIIGLLANGPAAASSWTGLLFIALFAPASLSETSQALSRWAQVSPAYYLYDGVQRTVLAQESLASQAFNFGVLVALGALLTWFGGRLIGRFR